MKQIEYTPIESVEFPEVEEQTVYASGSLNATHARIRIPEAKALVNPYTGMVYAINSSSYKTVLHQDLFASALEGVNKAGTPFKLEIHFPDQGRKMWAKFHLTEQRYEIAKGDIIHPTIEIFGSYDRTWASRGGFGGQQLVCTNGMTIMVNYAMLRTPHLSVFNPQDVVDMIQNAHGVFVRQTELMREWKNQIVTPDFYERTVNILGLTKHQEQSLGQEVEVRSQLMIEDMKWRTLSTFDFYQIVTQNLTHSREMVRNRRRQAETFQRVKRAFDE